MNRQRRARPRLLALAAVAILAMGGCDSSAPAVATTPVQGNADAYAACLVDHGIVLERYTAEDGTTRSRPDKTKNDPRTVSDAAGACVSLLPVDEGTATAPTAEDIEARRAYAACIRDHGIPEFPDPDPATGDFPMDDATAARVKEDPAMRTAMDACRSTLPSGDDSGVVGG